MITPEILDWKKASLVQRPYLSLKVSEMFQVLRQLNIANPDWQINLYNPSIPNPYIYASILGWLFNKDLNHVI